MSRRWPRISLKPEQSSLERWTEQSSMAKSEDASREPIEVTMNTAVVDDGGGKQEEIDTNHESAETKETVSLKEDEGCEKVAVEETELRDEQSNEMKVDKLNGESTTIKPNGTSDVVEDIKSAKLELPEHESVKLDAFPNSHEVDLEIAPVVVKKSSKEVTIKELRDSKGKRGFIRHMVAILALSSIILANMNRQVFNQALVSMTKVNVEPVVSIDVDDVDQQVSNETRADVESSSEINLILHEVEPPLEIVDFDDRYDWTGSQIGTLQAAFSYGYTPFMILSGRLSELYGAKWVVFVSGFGSALCCILTPYLADNSFILLVISRILMGICQTGVSPSLYALLTRWLPPNESTVYLPMIKVGVMLGYMSGSLVVGFFKWRFTFYMTGVIGLLWCALWVFTVTSEPSEHKMIGKQELDFIQFEIRRLNKGRSQSIRSARKKSAPWLNILFNPVVLAFMFAKFTVKLSTDSQAMQIPMYLRNVFGVSKELNGVLSATNFAIQGIFTGLVAYVAKEFVVRKAFGMNKTGVRRLFQGINSFGMALAYILMTFNMSSLGIVCCAVVLLSITSMFGAGGEAVTPVDLSTEYSASIMAIANSTANLSGIVLPPMTSFVLSNNFESSEHWNLVWRLLAAIIIGGGLAFSCFVTAEIQDFSQDKDDAKKAQNNGSIEMEVRKPETSAIDQLVLRPIGIAQ